MDGEQRTIHFTSFCCCNAEIPRRFPWDCSLSPRLVPRCRLASCLSYFLEAIIEVDRRGRQVEGLEGGGLSEKAMKGTSTPLSRLDK